MAIEKRISRSGKTSYRVRLRMQGIAEISETFDRASHAREFDAHTRLQLRGGHWGAQGEAKRHSVADAIDRYLALLPSLMLKDERNRRRQADWWRGRLGAVMLSELTPAGLATVRDELLVGDCGTALDAKIERRGPATVVRYLAALSAILTLAADDWGWLPDNPMKRVRKPKQPEGRVRYLSADELTALLGAVRQSTSQCLHDVVVLALAKGMRRREMLSLRWRHVDLERQLITLTETKNGKPRQLPLVGAALEAILGRAGIEHVVDDFVFPGGRDGACIDIT